MVVEIVPEVMVEQQTVSGISMFIILNRTSIHDSKLELLAVSE